MVFNGPQGPQGLKITFKPIFYDQKCMEIKIPGSKTIFDASKRRKNRKNEIPPKKKIEKKFKPIFYDQNFMPVKIPGSKVIFGASKRVKNEEKRSKKNRKKMILAEVLGPQNPKKGGARFARAIFMKMLNDTLSIWIKNQFFFYIN